jgi:chromosome segregation ATPase
MARTETPKKRVSNLVGRFEQLAQSSPVQEYTFPSPGSPTSPRPAAQQTERGWLQYDRRSMSLSSKPTVLSLSTKLERELDRNAKLRQEIDILRQNCTEGDDILTVLSEHLEVGTGAQALLRMPSSDLQTKVNRLADKLARRDRIQKAEYEQSIVAMAHERDMLASELQKADASVERTRALENAVRSADEKARIAEEKARVTSDQISTLRNQLLELKTDIAVRSRVQVDVSDQEILDMMNKLNHLVQNWCVSSFRKVKIGTYSGDAQIQ